MWIITLCCNVLVLVFFWLLSQVAITPTHNLMVQYAETGAALPILTDFAIQIRWISSAIPILWAVLTVSLGRYLKNKKGSERNTWLLCHAALTWCIGLSVLFFYSLAGILSFLKIAAVVD